MWMYACVCVCVDVCVRVCQCLQKDRLVTPADVNKNDIIQQRNYLGKNDVSQGASNSQWNETISFITYTINVCVCEREKESGGGECMCVGMCVNVYRRID